MSAAMHFALAVFACWRVTHLLASEDGPGDIVYRLRVKLGDGFAGRLFDCFYCLSVWVALPLAWFVSRRWMECIVSWLAVSGAACLVQRATTAREREQTDAVLWSEERSAEERFAEFRR